MKKQNPQITDQELYPLLLEINKRLKQLASFKRNFILSIVKGLGFTFGSTIVLSILAAILIQVSQSLGIWSLLQQVANPDYRQQQIFEQQLYEQDMIGP